MFMWTEEDLHTKVFGAVSRLLLEPRTGISKLHFQSKIYSEDLENERCPVTYNENTSMIILIRTLQ